MLYSLIVGRGAPPDAPGKRFYHVLYMNATRLARTLDWGEAKERFMLGGRILVAHHARRERFVAAGAVGHRGRAIVIVGLGQIVRTALVAALVRAGCTYLSSEYAPIADDHRFVLPFPNPLPIRQQPSDRARLCPGEEIGGSTETEALPVGLVVVAEHRPGAGWQQHEVSRGRGVLALMTQTVNARTQPQNALGTLGRALTGARMLQVRFGDVDEAACRLLAHPMWQSVPASYDVAPGFEIAPAFTPRADLQSGRPASVPARDEEAITWP